MISDQGVEGIDWKFNVFYVAFGAIHVALVIAFGFQLIINWRLRKAKEQFDRDAEMKEVYRNRAASRRNSTLRGFPAQKKHHSRRSSEILGDATLSFRQLDGPGLQRSTTSPSANVSFAPTIATLFPSSTSDETVTSQPSEGLSNVPSSTNIAITTIDETSTLGPIPTPLITITEPNSFLDVPTRTTSNTVISNSSFRTDIDSEGSSSRRNSHAPFLHDANTGPQSLHSLNVAASARFALGPPEVSEESINSDDEAASSNHTASPSPVPALNMASLALQLPESARSNNEEIVTVPIGSLGPFVSSAPQSSNEPAAAPQRRANRDSMVIQQPILVSSDEDCAPMCPTPSSASAYDGPPAPSQETLQSVRAVLSQPYPQQIGRLKMPQLPQAAFEDLGERRTQPSASIDSNAEYGRSTDALISPQIRPPNYVARRRSSVSGVFPYPRVGKVHSVFHATGMIVSILQLGHLVDFFAINGVYPPWAARLWSNIITLLEFWSLSFVIFEFVRIRYSTLFSFVPRLLTRSLLCLSILTLFILLAGSIARAFLEARWTLGLYMTWYGLYLLFNAAILDLNVYFLTGRITATCNQWNTTAKALFPRGDSAVTDKILRFNPPVPALMPTSPQSTALPTTSDLSSTTPRSPPTQSSPPNRPPLSSPSSRSRPVRRPSQDVTVQLVTPPVAARKFSAPFVSVSITPTPEITPRVGLLSDSGPGTSSNANSRRTSRVFLDRAVSTSTISQGSAAAAAASGEPLLSPRSPRFDPLSLFNPNANPEAFRQQLTDAAWADCQMDGIPDDNDFELPGIADGAPTPRQGSGADAAKPRGGVRVLPPVASPTTANGAPNRASKKAQKALHKVVSSMYRLAFFFTLFAVGIGAYFAYVGVSRLVIDPSGAEDNVLPDDFGSAILEIVVAGAQLFYVLLALWYSYLPLRYLCHSLSSAQASRDSVAV